MDKINENVSLVEINWSCTVNTKSEKLKNSYYLHHLYIVV